MIRPLNIVILGLSLSSSWGNGHATTYRALLRGLAAQGHKLLFLERDVPWYAAHRDLPRPDFCDFALYSSLSDLQQWQSRIAQADAVILGSYVPDSIAILDMLLPWARGRLVFYDIDTPVTLAALEKGDADYLEERQLKDIDLYLTFAGGAAIGRLRQMGARAVAPLYCSVDPALYHPVEVAPRWDLGYLGTYSLDRQPGLEMLLLEPARRLPDHRFVVAGAQFPDYIDWPPNVERIEHVVPADHAAFYSAQRFTLNLTRAAMRDLGHSPSVRIFEAAACGTAILSDRWVGLHEILPPDDGVIIADHPEDIVAALAMDDAIRQDIATTARARVLDKHTGAARACDLVTHLAALPSRTEVSA
jgi:spore maturation protein CgeB